MRRTMILAALVSEPPFASAILYAHDLEAILCLAKIHLLSWALATFSLSEGRAKSVLTVAFRSRWARLWRCG